MIGYKVITAVLIKIPVLWDVTTFLLVHRHQRFGRACRLIFQHSF